MTKEPCWKCKGSNIDEDGIEGCLVCLENINKTKQNK